MEIIIRGLSNSRKSYFRNRTNELIDLLRMRNLLEDKILDISFTKSHWTKNTLGQFDTPIHSRGKKLPYEVLNVKVNKTERFEPWTKVIIHELVHVKQYLLGNLRYIKTSDENRVRAYWKSKGLGNPDKIDYSKQPWEISASRLENYYWNLYNG